MIENELRDLLRRAADQIREFIDSEQAPHAKSDMPLGRFDKPYITNSYFREDDLPWADEEPWEPPVLAKSELEEEGSDGD